MASGVANARFTHPRLYNAAMGKTSESRSGTKHTIFISSTFKDLKDERDEIVRACLKMGHIPIGMEMFNAGDETQWELIQRTIAESDYYVLIVADRYGETIESEGGISFTEREYDEAIKLKIPVLGLVLSSSAKWEGDKRETDEKKRPKLEAFKKKVMSKIVEFWEDRKSLRAAFAESFMNLVSQRPRDGWVRASQAARPEVANEIARLSKENKSLRAKVEDYNQHQRQDTRCQAVIAQLTEVVVDDIPDCSSLAAVFRAFGFQFYAHGDLGDIAARSPKLEGEDALRGRVWQLIAFGLLERKKIKSKFGSKVVYPTTKLGRDVLHYWIRQKTSKPQGGSNKGESNQGSTSDPKS